MSRRSFNSRLFRWHGASRRPLLDPRRREPVAGARRRGDVAADRDRARRPGLAAVHGPLADAGRLAEAGTHELLAAWAGLGYNRRALALRECARSDRRRPRRPRARDGRRAGGAARDRAVHRSSGRGRGLRRAGRAARRRTSGVSSRGCSACRRLPPDSRLRLTTGVPAVSPVAGSMPSWISPRGRAPPARRCATRVPLADARALRAARCVVASSRKPRAVPFAMTSRWLRGRLVAAVGRGTRGDLGGPRPNGSATTTPTPSTWPREASNAKGSSSCRRGRRECACSHGRSAGPARPP